MRTMSKPNRILDACQCYGTANAARPVKTIPCALIVALLTATARGDIPTVAPNTTSRAIAAAAGAVVKLYGGSIGREHGYGTGFLVSPDGRIITTQSLLVAGRNVRAVLANGRQYDASVTRVDDVRKLAELKIDATDLPHLTPVKTESLQPGETVIAMGNWFKVAEGEEPVSVNRGILSLKTLLDAKRLTQDVEYRGPVLIYDAITANPGAPGGPLLNIDGECIGIVGVVAEAAATNTRLNYALPSEEIIAFLGGEAANSTSRPADVPKAGGEPYLGIKVSKLGFRHVSAYIERVAIGSPAAEAGIRKEDLIIAINGRRIADVDAYDQAVSEMSPGQLVQFVIKRGSQVLRADVMVGVRK